MVFWSQSDMRKERLLGLNIYKYFICISALAFTKGPLPRGPRPIKECNPTFPLPKAPPGCNTKKKVAILDEPSTEMPLYNWGLKYTNEFELGYMKIFGCKPKE